MRTAKLALGVGLFLATATVAVQPQVAEDRRVSVTDAIVNGVDSVGLPATAALLTDEPIGMVCSGTLIGCQTVLTAAHCFCGTSQTGADCIPTGSIEYVYFQHAGLFGISSISIHPNYEFAVESDVALIRLDRPVDGIAPIPINDVGRLPNSSSGLVAGFGTTSGSANDAGIKREGLVSTASCLNVPGTSHVCWNYNDATAGPPGQDSNTCLGDSGGPLFVDFGEGLVVAGVTSGGSEDCLIDNAFDADVFLNRDWIEQTAGSDLGAAACGDVTQAGETLSPIFFGEGTLNPSNAEDSFTLEVEAGTAALRVGLNANDDADFDLYVRRGAEASFEANDCGPFLNGSFEFCEFLAPLGGTWHVTVDRFSGSGDYQVVATTMGVGSATVPGCVERSSSLTLHNGRFRVSGSASLQGNPSNFFVGNLCGTTSLSDTALAFFFNLAKPVHEGFISIRDKCSVAAAAFSVEVASASTRKFRIDVEDTFTGLTQSYENPNPGSSAVFEVDNTSFADSCAVAASVR